jgi:hypothetical protein
MLTNAKGCIGAPSQRTPAQNPGVYKNVNAAQRHGKSLVLLKLV